MERRDFVKTLGLSSLGAYCSSSLFSHESWASNQQPVFTILHTNDTHSRIDPFQKGKYRGLGGISRRATLIANIKKKNPHTLVLDAGDIFQGTPYFNMFKGRIELETMSRAGYQYSAIGNHDFDLGAPWLLTAAKKYASFPFLCANLQFDDPRAEPLIRPYTIHQMGKKKLGIIGLCVKLDGLVASKLWKGVSYIDPAAVTKQLAQRLKYQMKCDAIILLSHIGYTGRGSEPGDIDLAKLNPDIDLIIGGHTHTWLKKPTVINHPGGKKTHIFQVGHSGIILGQIDIVFDKHGQVQLRSQHLPVVHTP